VNGLDVLVAPVGLCKHISC